MKKFLMAVSILAVGAVAHAYTASAPVSVSVDVTSTSNLVIMDGATQLSNINLVHKPIIFSSASGATESSIASQNFTIQRGDGTEMAGTTNVLEMTIAGTGTLGELILSNGKISLPSTLALASETETLASGAIVSTSNTLTSTITTAAINTLGSGSTAGDAVGTYVGAATLNVVLN